MKYRLVFSSGGGRVVFLEPPEDSCGRAHQRAAWLRRQGYSAAVTVAEWSCFSLHGVMVRLPIYQVLWTRKSTLYDPVTPTTLRRRTDC